MFAVTLFCIFAANDVLVALNQSYSSLGLLLIPIFAGSMVVFLPLAFFARTKKLACLLGISAVGATLMVDGAVFYVTDPPREYVGAAYGGAFRRWVEEEADPLAAWTGGAPLCESVRRRGAGIERKSISDAGG